MKSLVKHKMSMNDESMLNIVFDEDEVEHLGIEWNFFTSNKQHPIEEVNPYFVHHLGSLKYKINNKNSLFKDMFKDEKFFKFLVDNSLLSKLK